MAHRSIALEWVLANKGNPTVLWSRFVESQKIAETAPVLGSSAIRARRVIAPDDYDGGPLAAAEAARLALGFLNRTTN